MTEKPNDGPLLDGSAGTDALQGRNGQAPDDLNPRVRLRFLQGLLVGLQQQLQAEGGGPSGDEIKADIQDLEKKIARIEEKLQETAAAAAALIKATRGDTDQATHPQKKQDIT